MTKSNKSVGKTALKKEIRSRLRKDGRTQEDVALKVGVNVNTLRSALTRNQYGSWLFQLCRQLGLPASKTALEARFDFDLTGRLSTPTTAGIPEQMRARVDRINRALSDVDKGIGTFYGIIGKEDLVALLTYSKTPEEWEGQFIQEAALHGIKGGYLLYVVPSDEIGEAIRKAFPALACPSVAHHRAMHVWFMRQVDKELLHLQQTPEAVAARLQEMGHAPVTGWEQVRAHDFISFAASWIPLFMAPEHKYILFRHSGQSWAMAYYPLGRSTEESTRDVDLRHSFLPLGGGDLVRRLRLVALQAARNTLQDHKQLSERFADDSHELGGRELKTLEQCLNLLGEERRGD